MKFWNLSHMAKSILQMPMLSLARALNFGSRLHLHQNLYIVYANSKGCRELVHLRMLVFDALKNNQHFYF